LTVGTLENALILCLRHVTAVVTIFRKFLTEKITLERTIVLCMMESPHGA